MLKSTTFRFFDPTADENKVFATDLRTLLIQPEEVRERIFAKLPTLTVRSNVLDEAREMDEFYGSLSDPVAAQSAISVLSFFLTRFTNPKTSTDTPEDLRDDLREKDVLNAAEAEVFVSIMRRLKNVDILREYRKRLREKEYRNGVLPFLAALGSTVEVRMIPQQEYSATEEMDPPSFVDAFAVASIRLRVDEGNPTTFVFQVDEPGLDRLVKHLQKTLDEIRVAEALIKDTRFPQRAGDGQ